MGEQRFTLTFGFLAILVSWLIYLAIIEVQWTTNLPVEFQHFEYVGSLQITASVEEDISLCALYIAPTSLPFDGMGIYTTRALERSDIVAQPDSVSIPLIDIYARNPHRTDWVPLFNTYIWSDGQASSDLTFEAFQSPDAQMTLGMFPNHHSFLRSMSHEYPKDPYDDTLAQISTTAANITIKRNENSGGFSYHSGRTFVSSRNIEAGEELFIYYGNQFLDARPSLDLVPRRQDFFDAAAIVSSSLEAFNMTHFSLDSFSSSANSSLLESVLLLINDNVDKKAENVHRTASLLPKTQAELIRVLNTIAKLDLDQSTPNIYEMALAKEISVQKRSVEWIVENGYCLDNMIFNKSSIPGVGYGAYSRRRIPKNSIIIHTPMLQILHKDALNLYLVQADANGEFTRNDQVKIGMQLLLNYCLGHRQSNLLLCPTTNSMLINHCRKNENKHCDGPNAYFKWSDDASTNEWRKLSLEEIAQRKGRGLSIDFIASRDIQPGEEIFIDYGQGWIDAWNHHVDAWMSKSSNNVTSLFSSTVLNRRNDPIPLGENRGSSLDWVPDTLFTGCLYEDDIDWRPKDRFNISSRWTDLQDDEILALFAEDGSRFNKQRNDFTGFWPCLVLKKDDSSVDDTESGETYIVRIFHRSKGGHGQALASVRTWWHDNGVPRFLTKYPRDSIRYFHKPYQSDLFLKGAFRHCIEIPDDMFPQLWRDNLDNTTNVEDEPYYDYSNIRSKCKFRPGDHVEVKVDSGSDWVSGVVDSWCDDTSYYSISIVAAEYENRTRRVMLSNIQWSRTKRLSSSNWHPFF